MSDVEVTLTYPWDGHEVGEHVTVDASQAKRMVHAGVALFSTVKDATAAGGDPEQSITKKPKG